MIGGVMATTGLLFCFLGINPKSLSKEEKQIVEADLLVTICTELKEIFREQYNDYFRLMKLEPEMEDNMLDMNYIRWAIKDILLSGEYTLSGIAYYTQTPEEVVYEIAIGSNLRPSAIFLQRVIAIHREVKRDLYILIRKKIAEQYLAVA